MIGLDRFHCTDSYYTYIEIVWNLSIVVTVYVGQLPVKTDTVPTQAICT